MIEHHPAALRNGSDLRLIGATLGNPYSASTYSGLPYHLFHQLEQRGQMLTRINIDQKRFSDLGRGLIDVRRSIRARHPVRNAYWRFLPENIQLQSQRLACLLPSMPKHDAILQIGVGGIAASDKVMQVAHLEISVATAAQIPYYSDPYGFSRHKDKLLQRAIEGEKEFIQRCDLIWTNSSWTAATFYHHGMQDKVWIHAPACNASDPGEILREKKSDPHILFIGKDWQRKGGPELMIAFEAVKQEFKGAKMTIIGCVPKTAAADVYVCGYLDKNKPSQAAFIDKCLRDATVFCLPSRWESTGIAYLEAALYGLPVIMVKGQARDEIMNSTMSIQLDRCDPQLIADAIISLHENHDNMLDMAHTGRRHVLKNYTWNVVADRLISQIQAKRAQLRPNQQNAPRNELSSGRSDLSR